MAGHGYFFWNELMTRDVEKAKAFYGALIGWTFAAMPMAGGSTYWLFTPEGADRPAGGVMEIPAGSDMPGEYWFAYIAVDDLDGRLAHVAEHGGLVAREPFEVPGVGRIAIVRDAAGATLGWIAPEPTAG